MDLDNYDYTEIYLDSRNSSSTDGATSNLNYPTFYFDDPATDIAYIKVLEAQIPFSYFVVNTSNNTFTLTEGVSSATVTIPPGNYNSSLMATALGTALTTASPTTKTYTVTFSSLTQKFTIVVSAGTFSLTFGTSDDIGVSNPRLVLGFGPATTASSGTTLVATYTANLTGSNYLFLCSDVLGINMETYLPNQSQNKGSKGPQIACIPINVNPGDVIFYTDPIHDLWFSVENLFSLRKLDMYCTLGPSPQKLDFQGQSFSVKLGLMINKTINTRYKQNAAPMGTRAYAG